MLPCIREPRSQRRYWNICVASAGNGCHQGRKSRRKRLGYENSGAWRRGPGHRDSDIQEGTAGSLVLMALSLQRGPIVWNPGYRKRGCQPLVLGSLKGYRKVGQVGETRSEFICCWWGVGQPDIHRDGREVLPLTCPPLAPPSGRA